MGGVWLKGGLTRLWPDGGGRRRAHLSGAKHGAADVKRTIWHCNSGSLLRDVTGG